MSRARRFLPSAGLRGVAGDSHRIRRKFRARFHVRQRNARHKPFRDDPEVAQILLPRFSSLCRLFLGWLRKLGLLMLYRLRRTIQASATEAENPTRRDAIRNTGGFPRTKPHCGEHGKPPICPRTRLGFVFEPADSSDHSNALGWIDRCRMQ